MENKLSAKNEMILKRRKKKKIRKMIMLSILMISILVTLCLKLPYFDVKYIEVGGNNNISKKEIVKLSQIYIDNNIFYINTKKSRENMKLNPYIKSVSINRKLPKTINIKVVERNASFYIDDGKEKLVIDNNGVLLEKRKSLNSMKLVKVEGLKLHNVKIGSKLSGIEEEDRKIAFLIKMGDLMSRAIKKMNIRFIDLKYTYDIKVYYNNICIKLGRENNLEKKMNKALNIISAKNLKDSKGYIDVSFESNPVLYIEK